MLRSQARRTFGIFLKLLIILAFLPLRWLPSSTRTSLSPLITRQFLTLGASEFKHIWADQGRTAEIYNNNHPLATMDPPRRSMVLEDWARKMLEETGTNCKIQDPAPGKCIDGRRRAVNNAEYDFLLNRRRVEVKSSQLQWQDGRRDWKVYFYGLKFGAFDDLYLVIFSPQWLDLIKHDLTTGIGRPGLLRELSSSGIQIYGNGQWPEALDTILAKLCQGGKSAHLCRKGIDDCKQVKQLCDRHYGYTSQFYCEVPLASMSPAVRGLRVEKIVLEVDGLIHANSTFAEPGPEDAIDGKRRGKHRASYDWIRDGKRIEVKHSQLRFEKRGRSWCCTFHGVKRSCFDELLLVIYSPRGLDVFKHDGSYALSTAGVSTERICLRAGTRALDWLSALQTVEAKLEANGCPRIAQILWDS